MSGKQDRAVPAAAAAGAEEERLLSRSPEETRALGARLAGRLRRGDVVAFTGDLGTGKTCMIQGLCAALGVTDPVNSPTFVLITQYAGRLPVRAEARGEQRPDGAGEEIAIHHLDLYRLAGAEELLDIGADEIMAGDGLSLVEWADRGAAVLPLPRWDVVLSHAGDGVRDIRCRYRARLSRSGDGPPWGGAAGDRQRIE